MLKSGDGRPGCGFWGLRNAGIDAETFFRGSGAAQSEAANHTVMNTDASSPCSFRNLDHSEAHTVVSQKFAVDGIAHFRAIGKWEVRVR